jgi:adenylate kinase family enzyme
MAPRRISIIGNGGAGKSTLAAKLGARLNLPVLHRDRVQWGEGWVLRSREAYEQAVCAFVAKDCWVMDGNTRSTAAYTEADLVIWLDFPTWQCLWNICKRVARWNGRVRPDMADGCPERWDWEFMEYVATFNRERRPELIRRIGHARCPVFILRSHAEVDAFVTEVTACPA